MCEIIKRLNEDKQMSANKPLTREEFAEQHNCTSWGSFAEQAYGDYVSNEFPEHEKQEQILIQEKEDRAKKREENLKKLKKERTLEK